MVADLEQWRSRRVPRRGSGPAFVGLITGAGTGTSVQLEHEANGFVNRFEFVEPEPSNEVAESLALYSRTASSSRIEAQRSRSANTSANHSIDGWVIGSITSCT